MAICWTSADDASALEPSARSDDVQQLIHLHKLRPVFHFLSHDPEDDSDILLVICTKPAHVFFIPAKRIELSAPDMTNLAFACLRAMASMRSGRALFDMSRNLGQSGKTRPT